MKKIFLLLLTFASFFSVSAQFQRNAVNNLPLKNAYVSLSDAGTSEGVIENVVVYPNPVVDVLKVAFKSDYQSEAVISIFNNIGKLVYTQELETEPGNNLITIDVRSKSIDPGIYFLQLSSDNKKFSKKLIVK